MKQYRILLFAGILFMSLQALAQPEKGMIMVGGSAGFDSYSYGDFSSSTIYLSPLAGFLITDNLEVGASLDIAFFGGDDEGSGIGIGPFVRYYINNSGNARFFGQAGIDYSSFDPGDNFDSISSFGFDIDAGVDLFMNKHVAFEAALGFSSDKEKDDDESSTNIGLSIGVVAFIGGGE